MPEEGVDLAARQDVLGLDEIERIVGVLAGIGVRRVRLTGGEPTVRKDVIACVDRLARVPGIDEVVMTTNGHRLADLAGPLAEAGLSSINVSLDSLDAGKFKQITRRGDLARVLDGIAAAQAAGLPVKINTVALRGFNDDEVVSLCEWAWARRIVPRFIEWMPMSGGELYDGRAVLTAAEIRAILTAKIGMPLIPEVRHASDGVAGPARYWRAGLEDDRRVGIISAMSEHFCDTCNRVRLSATGELHTCLAYDDATDLRRILRGDRSETSDTAIDEGLDAAIRAAVGLKRRGHDFTRAGCGAPGKHMVSIGG